MSELLKFDVKIQEIIESEGNQENERDKFNRVDILAKDDKDDLILIEVQNEKEHDYFHRMNYAQAKLITERTYRYRRFVRRSKKSIFHKHSIF